MAEERKRRVWLAHAFVAYLVWGLAATGAASLASGGELTRMGFILLGVAFVVLLLYLGLGARLIQRIPTPRRLIIRRIRKPLYVTYALFALSLVMSIAPLTLRMLPHTTATLVFRIVDIGSASLTLLWAFAFLRWHLALRQIEDLGWGVKGHLRRGRMQGGLSVLGIRCTLMADRNYRDQPFRLPAGGRWVWASPKPPPKPVLLHPRLSSDRRKVIEHLQEWL
jgi:hypothetical protein